ncbi:MAG: hypothetical protein UV61_C0007G0028 [Candidatus Gottesmanbacteria bacterium GW2011_GWB1_43_11]|uniref:DUF4012 domain-containing protein n=1 Tax=Candidatus Gottesmanbacteria bacterium GW2011_GWB1_43_11 TaxID=1618446 RepID=A0A0G1CLY3_9BACT|nr:MAG: hypothetical protein UV04_C0006G0028 [Candidatus Gottesmanbacteria bacterium GW2011_GWA2_42_16]KKS55847.1 MAG: hypothetical protein UV17_C0006G0004 [Candidatus Gottesmanbacteria bacterium GW2011_GWA1_42_26]KKS86770.1 MAG: hypothetical protein UV61_C0007G0028 [Candidatus Gottesmanbacteria bacterium GW2011_GWB1_43_11]OGG09838.1 MAG: hypothetical protein A2699_00545 [Candidatus Gottesmanbacteria bacterium RIFCSPHIGHO2_01_FULL_43_15]HCM37373.1 hypothetical protein [Patescibacteria group bac
MNETNNFFETKMASENNPKAVFIGEDKERVEALALYLSQHSVDLFAGKTLDDAFYGDYFFYVGDEDQVKNFATENATRLPKTLLILTLVSDLVHLQQLVEKFPQIKVVTLGKDIVVDAEVSQRIIEFFLGSNMQILALGQSEKDVSQIKKIEVDLNSGISASLSPAAVVTPENLVPKKDSDSVTSIYEDNNLELKNLNHQSPTQNNLSQQVANLYAKDTVELPETSLSSSQPKVKTSRRIWQGIILGLLLLCLPFVTLMATTLAGGGLVYWSLSGTLPKPQTTDTVLTVAQYLLKFADLNLKIMTPVAWLLKQNTVYDLVQESLTAAEDVAVAGLLVSRSQKTGKLLLAGFSGEKSSLPTGELVLQTEQDLTQANIKLEQVEAELKSDSLAQKLTGLGLGDFRSRIDTAASKLHNLRELLISTRDAVSLLSQVALTGKKTYLVVFQNNMELRPTGGFIGSFGLLTLENGQIKDFAVEDVYTADGALKGHVDPPPPIRIHLEQEHWYMRDANWDPDFTQTAPRLKWFLEKELDISVDGVIALDLEAVKSILEMTGPIDLADFGEKITAENLFPKLQAQIQTDFFPGSTKKRDLLGALLRSLITQLMSSKNISLGVAGAKLRQNLLSHDILIWFSEAHVERSVRSFGWGGEMLPIGSCLIPNCLADYLMVVDANLGVNKANAFVGRKVKDVVKLNLDGQAEHALSVSYQNNSPGSGGLGGEYKNYLRIYMPLTAKLEGVTSDGRLLKLATDEVASESSVLVRQESNFQVVETLVLVPVQGEKNLNFSYKLVNPGIPPAQPRAYTYKIQKQPGIVDDFSFDLVYPPSLRLTKQIWSPAFSVDTLVKDGQITYNTTLSQDLVFEVSLGPR